MASLIVSWVILALMGWLAWPMSAVVFPHAGTRGYAYARPLALILMAWSYWLLNVVGILDNSLSSLSVVTLVWAVLGLVGWSTVGRPLHCVLRRQWRRILLGEALALGVVATLTLYKAHMPGILHTEQPMDFAFLNSCWVSQSLPPQDPWLSGHTVSYYYLGYLMVAMLGRLSGCTPGVAYNVGLIVTAGLSTHIAYGLIRDVSARHVQPMARDALVACVGAVGLVLAGNAEWLVEVLQARGCLTTSAQRWLAIPGLADAPVTGGWLPEGRWWWWRASRVIYDANMLGRLAEVITEIPAFSLVLGDLHPHVMGLPYLLLAMALGVSLYHAAREMLEWRSWRTVVMPLALGALGMINSWDLPTMLVFCGLAYAAGSWRRGEISSEWFRQLIIVALWLGVGAILPYVPFYRHLQSQASGLGLAYYAKTPLRHYMVCASPWFWIISADAVARCLKAWHDSTNRKRTTRTFLFAWLAFGVAPWLLTWVLGGWGRLILGLGIAAATGPWLLMAQSVLLAVTALELYRLVSEGSQPVDTMARLVILCGVGLTYLTEFFFVQDMFGSRTNTMFKVYYQAWAFFAIGGSLILARWARASVKTKRAAAVGLILIGCSLSYSAMAGWSKSEGLAQATWSLDGTAHLVETRPDEAAVIAWILENTEPDDVILLAEGEEFIPWTSRIAAWTGRPTVLGWPGHEAQWRGDDSLVLERRQAIETAYTTTSVAERDAILAKYDVRYVIIGPNEMDVFGRRKLAYASEGMLPVFLSETITLFAVLD